MTSINEASVKSIDTNNLTPIAYLKNNWRRRMVTVFAHPSNPDLVVSSGQPFDGGAPIICVETREDYSRAIEMFPQWAVYN